MDFLIPSIFTEYESNEVELNGPIHEEIVQKLGANNNFLLDLLPIGTIMFFNNNQSQGAFLDTSVWQYCDGSEITNPNSPIRSLGIFQNFVPDFRDKYPRGANDETNNSTGGSFSHNLNHSHPIGVAGGGGGGLDEDDKGFDDQRWGPPHDHGLNTDLASPTVIIAPKYVYLNAYMKVV